MGREPRRKIGLFSAQKLPAGAEVFETWQHEAMRLDEVGGGAVVFLSCGCCGVRGPAPTFGRIWVAVLTPCLAHQERSDGPLLLPLDHEVSAFAPAQPA